MTVLISAAGVVLLTVVVHDLFHTLFHPGGQATISRILLAGPWRLAKWLGGRKRLGELAGPLGMVAVISTWVLGIVLGGALVYWPRIAENFSYGVRGSTTTCASPGDTAVRRPRRALPVTDHNDNTRLR